WFQRKGGLNQYRPCRGTAGVELRGGEFDPAVTRSCSRSAFDLPESRSSPCARSKNRGLTAENNARKDSCSCQRRAHSRTALRSSFERASAETRCRIPAESGVGLQTALEQRLSTVREIGIERFVIERSLKSFSSASGRSGRPLSPAASG